MKKFFGKIGNFFKKVFNRVGQFFRGISEKLSHKKLYVLVMMQLKDKWNISWKTNKKAAFFKLVADLIVFAAVTAIVYLVMSVAGSKLGIFLGGRFPLIAIIPVFAIVVFFEFVSVLLGMTNALYFSKDNTVLITYAVKADYIFLSKVIVYYIDALKKSFMLFVPLFISFGMIWSLPAYYFIIAIIFDLVFVAFIVLLCGILSVPSYYVSRFLQKFRLIKILLSLAIIGVAIYLSILLINVIPSNINIIREYEKFSKGLNEFLYFFRDKFTPLTALAYFFFGYKKDGVAVVFSNYSWIVFLILAASVALLVFLNQLLAKPFYNKMIAATSARSTGMRIHKKNIREPKALSILHYEFARIFRDEKLLISTVICIVFMPLFTLLINKVYNSLATSNMGNVFVYIFNFAFILIVVVSHNTTASYIYSKDGPSWSVNKTMPARPEVSLSLRLVYNVLASLLIIIPSSIVLLKNEHLKTIKPGYFIITLFVLALIHIFWSASYDYSHSENKDKADIGSEIVSSHQMVSIGFGLVVVLFSALFIVITTIMGINTKPQLRLLILALFFLALEVFYFLRKIHLTYQEN